MITADDREFVLSDAVLDVGFGAQLWYAINAKHDLLLDEYESEDVPASKLVAVAGTIRDYVDRSELFPGVAAQLTDLAAFLEGAASREVGASFVM